MYAKHPKIARKWSDETTKSFRGWPYQHNNGYVEIHHDSMFKAFRLLKYEEDEEGNILPPEDPTKWDLMEEQLRGTGGHRTKTGVHRGASTPTSRGGTRWWRPSRLASAGQERTHVGRGAHRRGERRRAMAGTGQGARRTAAKREKEEKQKKREKEEEEMEKEWTGPLTHDAVKHFWGYFMGAGARERGAMNSLKREHPDILHAMFRYMRPKYWDDMPERRRTPVGAGHTGGMMPAQHEIIDAKNKMAGTHGYTELPAHFKQKFGGKMKPPNMKISRWDGGSGDAYNEPAYPLTNEQYLDYITWLYKHVGQTYGRDMLPYSSLVGGTGEGLAELTKLYKEHPPLQAVLESIQGAGASTMDLPESAYDVSPAEEGATLTPQTDVRAIDTPTALPAPRPPSTGQDIKERMGEFTLSEPIDIAFHFLKTHESYDKRNLSSGAIEHKRAYDTKYEQSPERVKYRTDLKRERRTRGIYGHGGPDVSHTKQHTLTLENPHENRARHLAGHTLKGTQRTLDEWAEEGALPKPTQRPPQEVKVRRTTPAPPPPTQPPPQPPIPPDYDDEDNPSKEKDAMWAERRY
jgi:hypothetical protein